jgi:Zn-dependent protease
VAGVRIRVHASFLLLFLLVVFVGAATTLEGALAEMGWILIIFACVVIHELAHSVTAIRLGTRVRDIVLLPLGGVSEMERLPDDPRRELAIAGAGPAASLALGAVLLAASGGLGQQWWPPALDGGPVLARLGWLNVLLAGFNLLPVLPMDGGRLLRAALERRLGRTGSTIAAARIGRIGGALLIAVGFFYDVWLLFIGAFILLGASAEGADAQAHQRLSGLRVESAMIRAPWTAEAHLYVDQPGLDQAMARQAILPVTSAGAFLGVLGPAQRPLLAEVRFSGDVADREAPAVGPEEPLDHALDAIQQGSQPGVAVLAPDRSVIGVVTLEALRRALTSTVGASA